MFLEEPEPNPDRERMYLEDVQDEGFVMNLTRAWAWQPELNEGLFTLLAKARDMAGLTTRQRALLITAAASRLGDSYCALAWGTRLAGMAGVPIATGVIEGAGLVDLEDDEATLVEWARNIASDPSATTARHVDGLRAAGFDDGQILALTVFTALRVAFSIVNDALGAVPDSELVARAPHELVSAITFGRPPG